MKPDEYTFWKEQFQNFKIKHLFTHIEGTSIILLTIISSIFLIAGLFLPIFAFIGTIGLITVVIIFALIKVEMKLVEIKLMLKELRR